MQGPSLAANPWDAVAPAEIDESPLPRELPRACALRLADGKAGAGATTRSSS